MQYFEVAICTCQGLINFQFSKFSIDQQPKYLVTSKTRNLDFVIESINNHWTILRDHDFVSIPEWVVDIEPALALEILRHAIS